MVIRDHLYVAGTSQKPEVGVFVQTHTKQRAINENKIAVGQTVWMKWNDGPIVAKSEILSWYTGVFRDGNINVIRELCVGSNLFGLGDYWKGISNKTNGYYAVILLTNEEWLGEPIFPNVRSFGSSWIYLDDAQLEDCWLTNDIAKSEKDKTPPGRTIPKGMRFDVLRRDSFTCQYCGRKAPEVILHVDHVKPWIETRKHAMHNLATSCADCNLGKGTKRLYKVR